MVTRKVDDNSMMIESARRTTAVNWSGVMQQTYNKLLCNYTHMPQSCP